MGEIIDYLNSIKRFDQAKEKFKNREELPLKNRQVALKWLDKKEKDLTMGLSTAEKEENRHRRAKTLTKYIFLLNNICRWFKDLENISLEELEQFKEDFYNDELRSIKGSMIKGKREYISKVIKSDFFKFLGHYDKSVKVFNFKLQNNKTRVEFLTFEDIKTLVEIAPSKIYKLVLFLLFASGMRIGTLFNIRKKDFELRFNEQTKIYYYLVHIRKEYTKSQDDRTIPIIIPECNDLLKKYLEKLNFNDLLINVNCKTLTKQLGSLCVDSGIRTKPDNKNLPTIHILRKSATLFWLNKGYSTDQVKALLGHKPSSDAIDVYANYSGMDLEPSVTRIQVDELLKLNKELEHNRMQLTAMQEKQNKIQEEFEKMKHDLDMVIKSDKIRVYAAKKGMDLN